MAKRVSNTSSKIGQPDPYDAKGNGTKHMRRWDAEKYASKYIAEVVDSFGEFKDYVNSAEKRLVKFFEAIQDGMPEAEAARYFLSLDAEQFNALLDANPIAAEMIQAFKGHVAREQYRKVINADGYAAAIRWLEQNRPEAWQPKSKMDMTVTHEYADLPEDELDRRIAEAERRKATQA